MRTVFPLSTLALFVAVCVVAPPAAHSGNVILNDFGFVYETGGFPTSAAGDTLTGLGVITAAAPGINCDPSTTELTWIIKDLVSEGQTSPDGGQTLIISYTGGTIGIYCDPSNNHNWGISPPNATAPASFEDGQLFLVGTFSQFVMTYFPAFQVGAYSGVVSFTGGTNLANLTQPNGMVFSGTIGPGLDPNVPLGYDLEAVGQIVAPALCALNGNVSFQFDPASCEKCKGVTELILDYTGTEDINAAMVDKGTLTISGNQLIITPDPSKSKLASNTTITVGSDVASIHTSCSQPIDVGNVIGNFTIASVSKILVPCEEDEKCEGVTRMVLQYFGNGDPNNVTVSPEATASVVGDLITILPTGAKLKSNTTVDVDGDAVTIHTSCSQPLDVGFVFGNYEVVELDIIPGDGMTQLPTSGPVVGASVDVVDGEGNIFSTLTDVDGNYSFIDLAAETLRVSIDVPLGYVSLSETSITRLCVAGGTAVANFSLTRVATQDKPRSKGFWKKQVNAALKGKEKHIKHTGAELLAFLADIHTRFDSHFNMFPGVNTLKELKRVLEQKPVVKKKASQFDKARAHFMALLLNVVSDRLATWQFISEDDATVSQAITHVANLLLDGDPFNDETAKHIAEKIIKRKKVEAGLIPLSTPQIAFAPPAPGPSGDVVGDRSSPAARTPDLIVSFGNYPNPFNPSTTIRFELGGEAVTHLAIYNIRGQKIRDLVEGGLRSGINTLVWDGKDNSGRKVASGVYFGRLKAGKSVTTKRMVLVR